VDQGATLVSFELAHFKTPDHKAPMDLVGGVIGDPAARPFALEVILSPEDPQLQQGMLYGLHECELRLRPGTDLADRFVCRWSDGKRIALTKSVIFSPGSYLMSVETEVRNLGKEYLAGNVAIQMTSFQGPVTGGGCFQPPPDISTPVCLVERSVEKDSLEDLLKKHKGRKPFVGPVQWTGVDMRYFLAVVIPKDARDAEGLGALQKNRCELVVKGSNAVGGRLIPQRELKVPMGTTGTMRFAAFMGPKEYKMLEAFWILGFICRPMLWLLNFFYDFSGNYGIAIILLTLVVKVITFWPSQKSYRSMEAMRRLKGPMDEIRAKYGNDKMRMNQELMNLYKSHKVNPLGGCLPLLIQMPVWIALYRTIYSSVEIYQQPFVGWINDLSAKDPYYVLPILLGIVMFVQQKMSPSAGESGQMRLMLYGMPVLFTGMMLFFPSGLVLYIFVNTLLSILQQWLIRRSAAKA
jgi:YidC/Oxa1 family membrane protein insertase